MSYQPKNYNEQGGAKRVIGGELRFVSTGKMIDETGKWDDLRFPASAVRTPGTGFPGLELLTGTIRTLGFDATNVEQVHLQAQMPHSWKAGSNITPHLHWTSTATSTEAVRWGLEYSVSDVFGPLSAAQTIYASQAPSTKHSLAAFGDIDMSAYTGPSTMLMCRLFRHANSSHDTYAADAYLMEFDFHYRVEKLGSTAVCSP